MSNRKELLPIGSFVLLDGFEAVGLSKKKANDIRQKSDPIRHRQVQFLRHLWHRILDVVQLMAARKLREVGVSLQTLRKVVEYLRNVSTHWQRNLT